MNKESNLSSNSYDRLLNGMKGIRVVGNHYWKGDKRTVYYSNFQREKNS